MIVVSLLGLAVHAHDLTNLKAILHVARALVCLVAMPLPQRFELGLLFVHPLHPNEVEKLICGTHYEATKKAPNKGWTTSR